MSDDATTASAVNASWPKMLGAQNESNPSRSAKAACATASSAARIHAPLRPAALPLAA